MPPSPLPPAQTSGADDAGLDLPLPTRVALWVLLGVSVLILLILVEYQRKQTELKVAQAATQAALAVKVTPPEVAPAVQVEQPAQPAVLTKREPLDAKQWTKEMAAAELEIVRDLAANDWSGEPKRTLKRLEPIFEHGDAAVKAEAEKLKALLDEQLGAGVRQQARSAADAAEDRADLGDYAGALQILDKAEPALSDDSPAARERALKALGDVRQTIHKRRMDSRDALLGAEDAPNAMATARELLTHTDEAVRAEAKRRVDKYDATRASVEKVRQARVEDARNIWLKLFSDYRAAVLDGNISAAEQFVTTAEKNGTLHGSVAFDDAKILKEMHADAAAIANLQNAAVALPANKRQVTLPLRRGQVSGLFVGSRGRQLNVQLDGGAVVSVKVETLSAGAFANLFGEKQVDQNNLRPAVWALSAHENPADAPAFMAKNYAQAKQPLPDFWKLQFSLEGFRFAESTVAQKMQELQAALKINDAEKARKALEEVQPALAALRDYGPIAAERLDLVKQGEKLIGRLMNKTLTFQSGIFPDEKYKGLTTDQISQYLDTQNKTDVGVQFGLKVGASGGLQRVLIKFDGIETAIGRSKIKKATLLLYQVESPRSLGANVGLFRIKRAWVPDSGTWRNFSAEKGSEWAVPGASGEDDITSGEDASVALDAKKGVWRSFDLTRYVQDILQGRWQNNGLLMRVTNGEPDYHVRFYPETDVEAQKDVKLRPKLVLDLESAD